jgi:hypothetical protein
MTPSIDAILPIIITSLLMILTIAFLLRDKLQTWILRLIVSYLIATIFSLWIVKYFSEQIANFTANHLNPVDFITWIYWLFEINISYLFVESFLTSLLLITVFWFLMINYISERKYLLIWFLIVLSYLVINVWITPLITKILL